MAVFWRTCPSRKLSPACFALEGHPTLPALLRPSDCRQLAHAARNNDLQAARLMVAASLPVDACSQHVATPLHWADFHGNVELVELLLPFDPPLEVQDSDFRSTPLGWAIHGSEHGWNCRNGNYPATVELLIRAGSKPPDEVSGTLAVQRALRLARGVVT